MIENLFTLLNSIGLLFLTISSGYTSSLLSCGIQEYLQNNVIAKHVMLFLFITLYILMFSRNVYANTIDNKWLFPETLFSALMIYTGFILLGKLQPSYVVVILIAIVIHMMLSSESTNKDQDILNILNFIKTMLIYFIGIVLVIGVLIYLYKQRKEQGQNFSWYKFIFGTPKCRRFII